jgi:hypothetical protein
METISYPFGFDVPTDIITEEIPEHLRERLAQLWLKRDGLKYQSKPAPSEQPAPSANWYLVAKLVTEELEKIENELRKCAGAGERTCIEYYKNWRFRCLDQQTLRAEYIARGGKISESIEDTIKGGPARTWDKDEVGHLCFDAQRIFTEQ